MGKLMVGVARILPLCAVLLGLPALAAAQSVTLKPNQGTVGTEVTATGMGWPPGAVVHAFFDVGLPEVSKPPAVVDSNGSFTLKFCVPKLAPGFHPTFFTINQPGLSSGPIFTITAGADGNCQSTAQCPDVYFIGVHGVQQDAGSYEIEETWQAFAANTPPGKTPLYISLTYHAPDFKDWSDLANLIFPAVQEGVDSLNRLIKPENNGILKNLCATQSIVFVGYSLGAWIVNDWLSKAENRNLWPNIRAVVLYGDPLWHRSDQDFSYAGLAAGLPSTPDPYANTPPGPGVGISDRWQSLCLQNDPVCGEGYPMIGFVHPPNQLPDALACPQTHCEHLKYTHRKGYDLTTPGGKFLASQVFPSH